MANDEPTYILRGVCGSTAHGLAHADSDEDLHGVFSWSTSEFWSLSQPKETLTGTDPDFSYHELRKFLSLASKSNPQVLELLWLDSYVEKEDFWGDVLIANRKAFASSNLVFHAYGGYADSQFKKLNARDGEIKVGTREFKNAKHMFRLLEQGMALYTTGELPVEVAERSWYLEVLPTMSREQINTEFTHRFQVFHEAKSVLPERPEFSIINRFLYDYRTAH